MNCGRRSRRPRGTFATAARRRRRAPASSVPRRPASATTRPTPRCCSRPRWARRRGRSPSASGRSSASAWATPSTASRSPVPGFLNVFLADAWYVDAAAADRRRRRGLGPRRAGAPGAGQRRVRLGQPDRPADRRQRAPRRVRRRARADARSSPATRSPASTTSTTPARRSTGSARPCAPARATSRCPRTATRATTWPNSPRSIPGAADARRRATLGAMASALIMEGIRATLAAYRVEFDTLLPRGLAARRRPVADRDRLRPAAREQGHMYESEGALWLRTTDVRRRQGPRAASARPARRRTSPPTSPTRRTSSGAASTARSTSSAPTITATSRGMKGDRDALGRGPGPARDPDPAVRARRRGRREGEDVQAPRATS